MRVLKALRARLGRLLREDAVSFFGLVALALLVLIRLIGSYLPLGDPTRIPAGPRPSPPAWAWL